MLALEKYVGESNIKNYSGIILETAHPAKFKETVDNALGLDIQIPEELQNAVKKRETECKVAKTI